MEQHVNGSNFTVQTTLGMRIVGDIQLYYTPVLITLGSIGNCLSVLVFFSTRLRKLSSSFYLAALAISDTGFLFALFWVWLNMVDVPLFNSPGFCQLSIYMTYVCSFLSAWFVVAFTVERFIAVMYPLKRPSMCTVARAKAVLCSLVVLALAIYSPFIWIATVQAQDPTSNTTVCTLNPEYTLLASVMNHVDAMLTFVLPFVMIASLNACISMAVYRLARIRRNLTTTPKQAYHHYHSHSHPQCQQETVSKRHHHSRSPSAQAKVTNMLLVVSTVFLCLNLPSYVMRALIFIEGLVGSASESQQKFIVIQQITYLFFNTNFGINFVLYCVTGQNFRRALCNLCCSCCPRFRRNSDRTKVVSLGSVTHHRTATLNGVRSDTSWREAHELLPLAK